MQIAEHYRELIRSGQLKEGTRLPSARQLVGQWNIAIATAAKVMTVLRTEGLVTTIPGGGGGTVVSARGIANAPRDRVAAARRWGRIYPPGEHARIVVAELVDAPLRVADGLGLEIGAQVIRRQRVTFHDERPVSASTSWFSGTVADRAPLLLVTERITQGTPRYIEEMTGTRVQHGRDQFTAGIADEGHATDLAIAVGSPVLLGRNWFRGSDGDVIEFGEYVAIAGRWQTYDYDLG